MPGFPHQAARSELGKGYDPMAQRKADKDAAKAKVVHEQAKTKEVCDETLIQGCRTQMA